MVVSYSLWQRRFGGRPDILGQTLQVHGATREIIGVMPPTFDFGGPNRKAELWLPAYLNLESGDPGTFVWNAVGRLRPDTTAESAAAQGRVLLERVRERWAGEDDLTLATRCAGSPTGTSLPRRSPAGSRRFEATLCCCCATQPWHFLSTAYVGWTCFATARSGS